MKKLLFVLMLVLSSASAIAGLFGPSNYDECVNKYTKDAVSNVAVTVIAYACKFKFSEKINLDYADCVLDAVPDVKTDRAASVLASSCKRKYPTADDPLGLYR